MRTRWLVALGAVTAIWWMRGREDAPTSHPRVQVGVLGDGFTMLANGRIVELDRAGAKQHEMPLKITGDVRLVGTRAGTAVGWQDGKKVKLATLTSDGEPDDVSTWGKKVVKLCDGAASNEHRFAVGWLESDGGVWIVHGPMSVQLAAATKPAWCGIASAEQNIALLWRDGAKLMMNFCGKKSCSELVAKVPVDGSDTLLGVGCVRDACLFATRDKQGTTKLLRVTERGRALVKVLEHAADGPVNVVGAGDRAFAIAYAAKDGRATIQRVTTDLAFTHSWHYHDAHAASLAWAGDILLVALQNGETHVTPMPR